MSTQFTAFTGVPNFQGPEVSDKKVVVVVYPFQCGCGNHFSISMVYLSKEDWEQKKLRQNNSYAEMKEYFDVPEDMLPSETREVCECLHDGIIFYRSAD